MTTETYAQFRKVKRTKRGEIFDRKGTVQAIKDRLEYLRGELNSGTMSYGELVELQSLASQIQPGDVQLLEAAGVPEFTNP